MRVEARRAPRAYNPTLGPFKALGRPRGPRSARRHAERPEPIIPLLTLKKPIFPLSTLFWRAEPPSQTKQPGQARIQLRDPRQIPPGFLDLKPPFVAQKGSWRPGALLRLILGVRAGRPEPIIPLLTLKKPIFHSRPYFGGARGDAALSAQSL